MPSERRFHRHSRDDEEAEGPADLDERPQSRIPQDMVRVRRSVPGRPERESHVRVGYPREDGSGEDAHAHLQG